MEVLTEDLNESSDQTMYRFVAFRKAEGIAEGTITTYERILQDLAAFFRHTPFPPLPGGNWNSI